MGDSAGQLSWQVDTGQLGVRDARALREAVDAVAHWLELWRGFLAAAVAVPLQVVVTVVPGSTGDAVDIAVGRENRQVHISVPATLVPSGAVVLRAQLLDSAFGAIAAASQQWPHEVLPELWRPREDPQPDDTANLAGTLELLEPDEMLILGRLDGTSIDELARFHEIDEYVLDRVVRPGLAEMDDTEAGCSEVSWIIKLPDR